MPDGPFDSSPRQFGLLDKLAISITSRDEDILRECPSRDLKHTRAEALLYGTQYFFESGILTLVGSELFSPDGQVHFSFVLGGSFISFMIVNLDRYIFLHAGQFKEGINQLRRGGMNIGAGLGGFFRSAAAIAFRLFFAVDISLLTGLFVGTLIFSTDIDSNINNHWQDEHRGLVKAANVRVDARIQTENAAYQASLAHRTALQHQLDAARATLVDPAAGDVSVGSAQAEVEQLLAQKAANTLALHQAEEREAGELGGDKGAGESGIPGDGPRHRADLQRVRDAKVNVDNVTKELADAEGHLDKLRSDIMTGAAPRTASNRSMLPELQAEVAAQSEEVGKEHDSLTNLIEHRDQAVQNEIEGAPDYVAPNRGLVARLRALREIARDDPEIEFVILLIDGAAMTLDLGAVIAKLTTEIPTSYAPKLAADSYLRLIDIVDSLDATLRGKRPPPASPGEPELGPDPLPPVSPAGDGIEEPAPERKDEPIDDAFPVAASADSEAARMNGAYPKRPRGRPRKETLN